MENTDSRFDEALRERMFRRPTRMRGSPGGPPPGAATSTSQPLFVKVLEGRSSSADEATVITLYVGERLNKRLIPKLKKVKPGTRIISHLFPIPGFPADKTVRVTS